MIWFWLTLAVIIMGIASVVDFSTESKSKLLKDRVLIIFAHPDDESMFFGPTLEYLSQHQNVQVHLLCLSNGNADGLGYLRQTELVNAASQYRIPKSNIQILSDKRLSDGMYERWDSIVIAKHIHKYITEKDIKLAITFDKDGISGHPNHKACFYGALNASKMVADMQLFTLKSVGFFQKYLYWLDCCRMVVVQFLSSKQKHITIEAKRQSIQTIRNAMIEGHRSQMVWFRYGWIYLSRYMFLNTLEQVVF
ncbi:pig-L, N-acetylglucosaminylphosphatidyl inositoldeacetylase [Schizosaccharomyces osmophilus]|uniref:N-acetylglucosaminylphosphatidylinositol deacetylase n=1 Tax=Schizosaccharomyces osmophilus TaxID=2545709 RepID=A0AAE9WBY1_9SCHI|nr:pig-L, N-acetylglucosaminylphosphatidyl inositoldeacetylase [Schizosaccharomyces osmophilus]WBW73481.1 pig-L, N-acetylglucosaminylphosphatidyl inositoldeacetylase [Schizosaccharomyces osmophilus]